MKKGISLVIISILLGSLMISFVSAQEVISANPNPIESFFRGIARLVNPQQNLFSVVGDSQSCGENGQATLTFATSAGDTFSALASQYCSSGHGLWDVFTGSNGWIPYKEYKDSVTVVCGAGQQCNFELYCCEHPEPTSTSQCQSWFDEYSERKTVSCSSWSTSYTTGYKCIGLNGALENNIPYDKSSYSYCTTSGGFDCYYYGGSGTTCTLKSYPTSYGSCIEIYSYQGQKLYSSKSTCEGNIAPTSCSNPSANNGQYYCYESKSVKQCQSGTWGGAFSCIQGYDCTIGTISNSNPCHISSICNANGICDSGETLSNCPEDCTQTCSAQGGVICNVGTCSGNTVTAKDINFATQDCCIGTCDGGDCNQNGEGCLFDSSCCSNQCSGFKCVTSGNGESCSNGIKDGAETGIDCGGSCQSCDVNPIESITWSEYYSMSNEKFAKSKHTCETTSQCSQKLKYNISCNTDEKFAERTYDIIYEECDSSAGLWNELIYGALWIGTLGLIKTDFCAIYGDSYTQFKTWWSGNGVCIAESTTWYGKMWDSMLNMVGGFGIPEQYVLIATIAILFLIIIIIINMIK